MAATWGKLEPVEVVHLNRVNSRYVPESLGQALVLKSRGPNFWTCLLFSFASFHAPGGVDLGNISPGLVLPQEHDSLLGLGATKRGTSG